MESKRFQDGASDLGTSRMGSINHLRLTVTDIERARQFYGPLMQFLGYEVVDDTKNRLSRGKRFSTGMLWFILTAAPEDRTRLPYELLSPGFHHLAWNADSRGHIDDVHHMMRRNGVTVLDAPAEYDYEPGYYAVFFADPDGMKIEVMHVPMQAGRNEKRANKPS
jgi:glyoxylase I family protein